MQHGVGKIRISLSPQKKNQQHIVQQLNVTIRINTICVRHKINRTYYIFVSTFMLLNDVFVNVIYRKIMLCMLERDILR